MSDSAYARSTPIYQRLAELILQRQNLLARNDGMGKKFLHRCENLVERIMDKLPCGSGFDNGTKLLWNQTTPEKLVFKVDYHHMDDNGYYVQWTHHTVIVRPSLVWGCAVRVTGRNYRDIKDYIAEVFTTAMREDTTI